MATMKTMTKHSCQPKQKFVCDKACQDFITFGPQTFVYVFKGWYVLYPPENNYVQNSWIL